MIDHVLINLATAIISRFNEHTQLINKKNSLYNQPSRCDYTEFSRTYLDIKSRFLQYIVCQTNRLLK